MDYELSDAHKLIRDTARRIAREKVAPRAAELDETGEYPHDIFAVFAEAGLLGLTIPEAYGGSGAGFLALALAVEETAKHDNACSLILLLSALSTQPINLGGSEEQKRAWLSKSAAGGIKGAFCLTEPNTGSDAANLESRARRDGDEIAVGQATVLALHTPGHTPGSTCYIAGDILFSGDVLFPGGPGRTQTPADLRQSIGSITERLHPLPDETLVLPGHGADTTVGDSKREYAVFASKDHPPDLCGDVLWQV